MTSHINDVDKHLDSVRIAKIDSVGSVENLKTTEKSNIVNALNEVFQDVDSGKKSVSKAIIDKSGVLDESDTFKSLVDGVYSIPTANTAIIETVNENFDYFYYYENGVTKYTKGCNFAIVDLDTIGFYPQLIYIEFIGGNYDDKFLANFLEEKSVWGSLNVSMTSYEIKMYKCVEEENIIKVPMPTMNTNSSSVGVRIYLYG